MRARQRILRTLGWVALFSAAFALVEASVVIYLRALYYHGDFTYPVTVMQMGHLRLELAREAATIIMLLALGMLAGARAWERFAFFLVAFGVWDVLFYAWLAVTSAWPSSLWDWDILFLIPVPWVAPVMAPVAVSVLMIVCGILMALRVAEQRPFHPNFLSWIGGLCGTGLILWSFMTETGTVLQGGIPSAYHLELLVAGLICYAGGFWVACRPVHRRGAEDRSET